MTMLLIWLRHGRGVAAAALALGLPLAALARQAGRASGQLRLLKGARRLPTTGGPISWASDQQVITLTDRNTRGPELELVDVDTGKARTLMDFETALGRELLPWLFAVSPDGKHLLWAAGGPPDSRWIVSTLEGRPEADWKSLTPGHRGVGLPPLGAVWKRDSSGWVEVFDGRVAVYSLDPNRAPTQFSLTGAGPPGLPLGFTSANELLVEMDPRPPAGNRPPHATFLLVRPFDARPTWRQYSVPVPAGEEVADVALSPAGDRLAWVMSRVITGFRITGQQDGHPFADVIGSLWWSFWESALDGGGMTEIGGLLSNDIGPENQRPLNDLAWTPGGRRLSFRYHGDSWTVPVPPVMRPGAVPPGRKPTPRVH